MSDLHDLAAPYVLDALDDDERQRFEAHLAECAQCQATVDELDAGAVAMAGAVSSEPPSRLRAAVLEAVASTPQDAVVLDIADYRRTRRNSALFGVAAAILAVVATVATVFLAAGDPAADILAAPDVATIELTGPAGAGRFTFSVEEGRGFFVSDSLPGVSEDRIYQMWLIDDQGPNPAGLFEPGSDGRSTAIVEGVTNGVTVGITEEPSGGSDQPTGEVLLAGEV